MKVFEELTSIPGAGLAGLAFCTWRPNADPTKATTWFQFDKTKNYVLKLDIKDNYPDETPAHLNVTLSNETESTRTWPKEYGEDGFYVTGDYETYGFTFNISENFNIESNNAITVGFLADNAVGESFSVDTSAPGKIYFAEEVAYNIKNEKTSAETGLFAGDTATFEAQILNQIGSEGYLDQNVEWLVLDESRSEEISGFTIETDATTKNATVTVGDTVPSGTYAVVAYSEKYDMAMGQEIKVYDENYYKDYKPQTLTDNLLGRYDISPEREFQLKTQRHNTSINTDTDIESNITENKKWSNETSTYYPRAMKVVSELNIPGAGVAGVSFIVWKNGGTQWFKFDKSKNYVFKLDMKDNYPDETPVLANVTISNETEGTRTWSKEYGEDGFYLTGDYETYGFTFKVHENFNPDSGNSISVGFLAGNAVGESFSVDTSRRNIYLAEEKAYDIEFDKVSGPEKLQTGNSVTFEAKLVNQIGSEGYLTQDFDWYVMDTERKEFIDGFTIDVDAATKKATVTPGASVPTGRYDVVAVSDKYAMAKGQTIRVIADDYYNDYQKKAAPANIYETIYGANIPNGIMQRNTADVNVNKDNAPVYNFFASANISYGQYNAINGWITNKLSNTESYNKFEVGKSYLFKVRAKDASTNGEAAAINAVIHNETSSVMTHNWPVEKPSHSDGYVLTDEYADYIFTIPVGTNFDANAGKHFLTFGFAGGTLSGAAFDIDFSVEDAIYLAEEVVYDIKNEVKAGQTSLKAGETVTLEASVVNQLDKEGTLEQNFTWVAMDTNRKNIIEGITVTPNADTTEATVTVADTVAVGTYTIVAVSEDYDIAKGININVAAAAEKISAFEMKEDSGYVMLDATVVDSTAEKIFFVLAAYTGTALSAVKSLPVDVVDGVASVEGLYFDDALASGTTVKAFIWNYGTQDAIDNPNAFVTSLIVK